MSLSPSAARRIFEGSLVSVSPDGRETAVYGKTYRASGIEHVVDASIYLHSPNDYHVTFYIGQENRGKPPRVIKPPEHLMSSILENVGGTEVAVNVYATYNYASSEGWQSGLVIPFEFESPLRLSRGVQFTHISGYHLSNIKNDVAQEWVDVNITEDGVIVHEIALRRRRVISKGILGGLLKEGNRMSSRLVHRLEEAP